MILLQVQCDSTLNPMCVVDSMCFRCNPFPVNATTSSKVGELMKDQLRQNPPPKEPLPDEGIEFFDSGSESDDSGLRELISSYSPEH